MSYIIVAVFGITSISLILMNLVFFPENENLGGDRAEFLMKCAGIGSGIAALLYHAVIKLPEFYKLVKENLI